MADNKVFQFFDYLNDKLFSGKEKNVVTQTNRKAPEAQFNNRTGQYTVLGGMSWNGEKYVGEMGPIRTYSIAYEQLRARSWQMYLESEIVQTIIRKFGTWVIGTGLKLQSEPDVEIISDEQGGTVDKEKFSKLIEKRWSLYAGSKRCAHNRQKNMHALAMEALKNALIGGDVLVILRYDGKFITVQLVDGANVQSPIAGTESYPGNLPNGHKLINGIEINETGEHIAYYVRSGDILSFKYDRVEARGKDTKMLMAFMIYGNEYRINNHRGLPLLGVMFETATKMDRYKDATLGSAEERAKIAFQIIHKPASSGENPFVLATSRAMNLGESQNELPEDDMGNQLQERVVATTNKQSVNMPIDSEIKPMMDTKNELHFKDFYGVLGDITCASVEIPPNVAMSKYDSNFSASRAALKDWENTLRVKRAWFSGDFYQPIYELFLYIQIFTQKVTAPGYLRGKLSDNEFLIMAFNKSRYVGVPVPHIDPVKEVEAERKKLGTAGEHIPLTTAEQATENIGGGEYDSNVEQFGNELEAAKKNKIEMPEPTLGSQP